MDTAAHLTNDVAKMLSLPPRSPLAERLVQQYYSETRKKTGGVGNTHQHVREQVVADHTSGRLTQRYVTMLHDPKQQKVMTEAWKKMVAETWPTNPMPSPVVRTSEVVAEKKTPEKTGESVTMVPKVVDLSLEGVRPGRLVRESPPAPRPVLEVCAAAREATVTVLTKQLEEMTAALTKMADRVEQRERCLKTLETTRSQLETDQQQLEMKLDSLGHRNQSLQRELKQLVRAHSDLRREHEGLMERNERYAARIDDLERKLRERDAEDEEAYEPPSRRQSHRRREEKKRRRR